MDYIITNSNELYHYGVKGMRWGVRKQPEYLSNGRARVASAKANYKAANKQYSKDYNRAYNYSSFHPISQFVGEKQKAESNKRWRQAITSATVANKAKRDYKAAKIDYKIEKKNAKYDEFANKILSNRETNREKISNKFDKKIARAKSAEVSNALKTKRDYKLKDFDEGTKLVTKGINHYKKVNSDYGKMKVAALNDRSIKKTAKYKEAGKRYSHQKFMDSYGKAYTTLVYASEYATGKDKKKNGK